MKRFRNKFLIRRASGHPGYRSTKILATREDLAALADEIKAKLAGGYEPPFVSHFATEERGASSRVYLQFEPVSEKEMDAMHAPNNSHLRLWIRPVVVLSVGALAAIGAVRFWHWISTGLW